MTYEPRLPRPIEPNGVRIGLALPQVFTAGPPDPGLISAFAAEAERGGFDSLLEIGRAHV